METTVVVVSNKQRVLTNVETCPVEYSLVVSRKYGLGKARNFGARKGSDLLVFLDDDIILQPSVWNYILAIPRNEFRMTKLNSFPCTRVMAIHSEDFWKVGGFDENILVTGEDRDFYVRALDRGLAFTEIPIRLISHITHERRTKNIHTAVCGVKENMSFVVKYWREYPEVFKIDFLNRLRKLQMRTLLLQLCFLPYVVWRTRKRWR